MTQSAFSDIPPKVTIGTEEIQPRPMLNGFRKVFSIVREILEPDEVGNGIILAYIILHSPTITPSDAMAMVANKEELRAAIYALEWQVSLTDIQKVDAYLGRVFNRLSEAQIETPPGE